MIGGKIRKRADIPEGQETEPDNVSVKVNDTYFYKDIRLSTCLSGDFSNLPFAPEIVCDQGKSGSTKTVIGNISIKEKN